MRDVVILSAVRTPIGGFMGALASMSAPSLGAEAVRSALARAGVDAEQVDHSILGNVLQAGVGQAPARQAALAAGIPQAKGAITLNKVCGSGMRAIMDATNAIRAEEFDIMVAGGMESMSNAPHLLEGSRAGYRMGSVTVVDSMLKDGLWDPYGDKHMGNCAETCVAKYQFTREAQDAFAIQSIERARQAIEHEKFQAEVVPVAVPQRKGDPVVVARDEGPFKAPIEKIPTLKPAFDPKGTVTAANASSINDGAAALVLTADARANAMNLKPLARVVAYGSAAHEPEWFTTAPIPAAERALKKAGLTKDQIDFWEINEAFAAVAMAFTKDLDLDPTRVNARGGAVALGHPIGCSGARIVTTLVHTLIQERKRYGCAAICIGGGEGTALVIENLAL